MPGRTCATSATPPNPPIARGDSTTPTATRNTPRSIPRKPTRGGAIRPPANRRWSSSGIAKARSPCPRAYRFNVAVVYDDPPFERSGMLRLETDPDGKLIRFEAVPPQVEKPAPPAPPFDWNKLFQAAGLDDGAISDHRTHLDSTGQLGHPRRLDRNRPGHRSQAAHRGRRLARPPRLLPHHRSVDGCRPYDAAGKPEVDPPPGGHLHVALIAACVLGWHNFRTGKADRRGATRLSLILFRLSGILLSLLRMHHTATLSENVGFWTTISIAMLNAVLNWVFYVALEPWVRRKWPRTMISWTRYTSKGASDPLVGRDLLYGTVFGAILDIWRRRGRGAPRQQPPTGVPAAERAVGRARRVRRRHRWRFRSAIFTALLFFFMLFLLRLVLRKEWIAGAAFVAIITVATNYGTTTPWVDYPLNALAFAIFAFALLRFGLLAVIVTSAVGQILTLGSLLDFSAWYAGMAVLPFVMVALLVVYGFRVSLGGRTLLKQEL